MQPVIKPRALVSTAVVKMASSCSCCKLNQTHTLTSDIKHPASSYCHISCVQERGKAFSKQRHYSNERNQYHAVQNHHSFEVRTSRHGAGYLRQAGRLDVREPRGQQARHEASRITIRNPVTQARHGCLQITQSLKAEAEPLSNGLAPGHVKSW